MDSGVAVFAQVMVVVIGSLAAVLGISLVTRFLWRIGSRPSKRALPAAATREEFERLQTAVDAIAIEVERISESQRFTITLLGKQLEPPPIDSMGELPRGSGSRVDTPV